MYDEQLTSREATSRLKSGGWQLVNIRGSHHQDKHPAQGARATVSHPEKDMPKGTLRSIFRQANWERPPK
ncbi:MAG: type II toxin-antitoxin system HicA family toxin [Verrucomicrobiota bacterium]